MLSDVVLTLSLLKKPFLVMGAPRRPPPIEIYQDPEDQAAIFHPLSHKPRPQLQPSAIPRQPVLNSRNLHNVALNAPAYSQNIMSPQKMAHFQQPMIDFDSLGYVDLPAPQMSQVFEMSPSKRMVPGPSSQFGPPLSIPNNHAFEPHFETFDQENANVVAANDNADFPSPPYSRRGHLKRSISDVAPLYDRGLKRQRVEETKVQIPEPDDMPTVEDDGSKPPYSYAQMIGMAILRAKGRKLTLAQIYDWISSTFEFYAKDPKQGWHNSIRHNLSLNKAFGKTERPKGDPGKGCYWVIVEGLEGQFLKDKSRKASNTNTLNNMTMHTNVMRPEPMSLSQPPPLLEPFGPTTFVQETFTIEARPQTAPAVPDISSDATVPASDLSLNEEAEHALIEKVNPVRPQSSPSEGINSSPPVVSNAHRRSGSSPSARRPQPPLTGHKRNVTAMNMADSGYWSSLESSIIRPRPQQYPLTSDFDVDHQTKKQRKSGRAEDEIARIQRIRSSSQDVSSPTLRTISASTVLEPGPSSPPQSSPNLQPTTPAVFKKPARPIPESVSPNTQLANHRRAMSSLFESPTPELLLPNYSVDQFSDATSPLKFNGTPGLALNNSPYNFFDDSSLHFTPVMTPNFGQSPLKAVKRPPLARSTTGTSNKLYELLHSANVNRDKLLQDENTPSKPGPWARTSSAYAFSGSPVKNGAVLYQDENVVNDFINLVDDGEGHDDDEFGVDIATGFPTIGLSVINPTALSKRRPGLGGRSHTSYL